MNKYSKRKSESDVKTDGKRKFDKSAPRESKKDFEEVKADHMSLGVGCNDPKWYTKYPTLANDSGSFPFNTAVGIKRELHLDGVSSEISYPFVDGNHSIEDVISAPVLAIYVAPSIGVLRKDTVTAMGDFTAVDTAQMQLYSWTVYHNSRAKSYDPIDQMVYLVSMGSLVSFMSYCTRLYGLLNYYNQFNRSVPRALLAACGLTESAVDGLAINNFRGWLNRWITRLASYYIPALPFFERKYFVNQFVYKDTDDQRAQLYIMVEDQWLKYNPTYDSAGSGLEMITFNSNNAGVTIRTLTGIMALGDELLTPFVTDQDIGLISGDLLKAFENDRFTVPLVPEDYVVLPVYNEEVCHQIHNSSIPVTSGGYNHRTALTNPSIPGVRLYDALHQNTGRLTIPQSANVPYFYSVGAISVTTPSDLAGDKSPTFFVDTNVNNNRSFLTVALCACGDRSRIIDTASGALTPEGMLVATRLTYNSKWTLDSGDCDIDLSNEVITGTEIPYEMMLIHGSSTFDATYITAFMGTCVSIDGNNNEAIAAFSVFPQGYFDHYDWRPQPIYGVVTVNDADQSVDFTLTVGADLDSYTIINNDNLNRLHDVANLSLFYSPRVGQTKE